MKFIINILFFLSLSASWAQVIVEDTGLKQCLNDNYSTLMKDDSTLDTALTHKYQGKLTCTDYTIGNIGALIEFPQLSELTLNNVTINDWTPVLEMSSLRKLDIVNADLPNTTPDFSALSSLENIKISNANLTEVPTLKNTIQSVILLDNQIQGEVKFEEPFNDLIRLTLTSNQITSITGLANLPNIKELLLGNNQLTELESVENNTSLEILRVYGNFLTHPVKGLESISSLKELNIRNMGYQDMFDVPNIESLEKVIVNNNQFTFEDLLPFLEYSNFPVAFEEYQFQRTQGEEQTLDFLEYDSWTWTLGFDDDVSSNYYLWFKNNILIDSTTSGELVIDDLSIEDIGVYTCKVKNALLPDVTINVNSITINVEKSVGVEKSTAFTPNGDGDYDTFFIKETGSAQLISEKGELVKELETPEYWDGTDNNGNSLPLGYYILLVDGEYKYGITIVR
ncbi:MAG: hypothetical protein GY827_06300 [Cytophagales bacterium]|nr:hypothetical protein [Cytophagales bacterium]